MAINVENYESWFLDYIEGSLTAGQIHQVHRFVEEHPDLARELQDWKGTILKPDTTVVFRDKESLKKRQRVVPIGWVYGLSAIAAAILLFWLVLPLTRMGTGSDQIASPGSSVAVERPPYTEPEHPVAPSSSAAAAASASASAAASAASAAASGQNPVAEPEPATAVPVVSLPHAPSTRKSPSGVRQIPVADAPAVREEQRVLAQLPQPLPTRTVSLLEQPSPQSQLPENLAVKELPELPQPAVALQPQEPARSALFQAINERLPVDVNRVVDITQNAAASVSGVLSGESALGGNRDRNKEETRVFQFSVGAFKVYHKKSPKSAS